MRYLIVASQLGFQPDGSITPGGLLQFGRCVVRALSASRHVSKLGIYCQVDDASVEMKIRRMVEVYAHPELNLEIKGFGGSEFRISIAVINASITKSYDRIMYLLVNQSILSLIPGHLPYDVWEIGEELFHPVSFFKARALQNADRLLSISNHTALLARKYIKGLRQSKVVPLCLEPPLYMPIGNHESTQCSYIPSQRKRSVLIVGNLHTRLLYKGHLQLIDSWPKVVERFPDAQLWIAGDGDGKSILEARAGSLPPNVKNQIKFWGYVNDGKLTELYKTTRVFAMPSVSEGFGLVFVEAASYGLPCIGGKYDSVKEIIRDGETGLLVEQNPSDIGDACIKLLENDVLAKRFGDANNQNYVKKFQFSQFRERLLNALELES